MIALTDKDRQGLTWLQAQAGKWLYRAKRFRKYGCSADSSFTDAEIATLKAIVQIRDGARRLLDG